MSDHKKERGWKVDDAMSDFESELRGRQSVRATFKISEGCITAISVVASQMGIKQKSLFDHLVEDPEVLQAIADQMDRRRMESLRRVQKTFVLSRRSLDVLDHIAKTHQAPRDALVEYSVQRLMPIILAEKKKHQRRKENLPALIRFQERGQQLLGQLRQQLGPEDPMVAKFEWAVNACRTAVQYGDDLVDRGRGLEDFEEV